MTLRKFDGSHDIPGLFFNQMKHIVVLIRAESGDVAYRATGSLIRGGRYILTCYHTFEDLPIESLKVQFWTWKDNILNCPNPTGRPGPHKTAKLHATDPSVDLALLKVDSEMEFDYGIVWNGAVPLYSIVHSISMAAGHHFCYHYGTVKRPSFKAGAGDLLEYLGEETKVMEVKYMSSKSYYGASGSPIFNQRGMIVGVRVCGTEWDTYAITAEEIKKFLGKCLQ